MKGHYVARVCLNVKLSEAIAGDATARALALATFLGLGLLSTGLSVAQDAIGGVTSWSGSYGTN